MDRIKINFTKKLLYPVDTRKITFFTPEEVLSSGINAIPASIPGNVEVDLQNAKIIPEIFFGTNVLKLEEYELFDYWYNCEFNIENSEKRAYKLIFEGLDTITEIWLNGRKIGETDNMFIPHDFFVGEISGKNELWIRIKNPIRYAEEKEYETGQWGLSYNAESVHIRKAPHSFGWIFAPGQSAVVFSATYI